MVVEKRCKAAKEAYYGMNKAWTSSVSLRTKANVYKGLVVNTLMSGLEAETLRACDFDKLEKCMMGLARRLVGSRGVYKHGDTKRQVTNEQVRRLLRLTNVHDELRIRRLKWLHDMHANPHENVQLRAALGGRLKTSRHEMVMEYVPWLDQLVRDVKWYVDETRSCLLYTSPSPRD